LGAMPTAVRVGMRAAGVTPLNSPNRPILIDPGEARIMGPGGRVALGGFPPRAPTDPYVRD